MLDTFKARLKAKYPKANLSQKRIDAFADRLHKKFPELTEEADHDAKIDDYYPEEDIMVIAKQDDTIRTLKAKPKDTTDTTTQTTTQTATAPDDAPEWAKSLIQSNQTLAQQLQALQVEKTQQTINQKLSAHDKLKDIPAVFWNKRKMPEKEDEIDAFVDDVANDYTTLNQSKVDQTVSTTSKPVVGSKPAGDGKVSPMMATYISNNTKKEANA